MNTYINREQCKQMILEVTNFTIENDLSVAIIFNNHLITGGVEHRLVYAENANECRVWLDHVTNFLKNLSRPIPYVAYMHLNGEIVKTFGDITFK